MHLWATARAAGERLADGRCCVLLMLVCPSVPAGVVAQAVGGAALCWRARPRPQCGAFVLTDAGGYGRLVKAASDEGRFAAVFDYGVMVNVTPHDAVGASFFASLETNPAAGPAVRYRRWFDSNSSLDVALGVPTNGRQSGVFGLVKVNPTHWLGVALRPKLIRAYDYSNCPPFCAPVMRTRFGTTAGVELSGPPGVAASAVGLLALIIAFASLSSD